MKKNKTHFIIIAMILLVATSLILIFSLFRIRLNSKIQDTAEKNLFSTSSAISAVFYTKLDDQLVMLESQSRYFQSIDLSDYNAMKETIMSTKGIGDFKNIGVANASGATINYNGTSSGNIYLEKYFQDAMKGNSTISESIIVDEDNDEVLVLAVPIKRADGINGIIYGTFTKNILDSIIDTVSSAPESAQILVNSDGQIIAKSNGEYINHSANFLNEALPNAEIPEDKESKIKYYDINGRPYIAVLVPIGVHDWYFINILPESIITDQSSKILFDVIFLIISIFAIFTAILIYMISLIHKNERISSANEKFRLAINQSNNVIFAYDCKAKEMTIEGNLKFIFPHTKVIYNYDDIKLLMNLAHPEDINISKMINTLYNSQQNSLLSEFRLKCADGHYYWFRFNASLVRDSEGNPSQIIGNVFNVDEQMNKEKELLERAETDSLTGLLNKGAYQSKLCRILEEKTPADITALFIIDLDNFKAVNDNLGHAMGAQVLSDVAVKLNNIFSVKNSVGRIGGDEFSAFINIENSDPESAEQIIRQKASLLCETLKQTYSAYKIDINVSASIGIAVCSSCGISYDTLYKNADKALYRIKRNGKGNYSIYSEEEHYE